MAYKILSWILGILLGLSILVVAFEFFGSDQFKPTTLLGLRKDQQLSQISDEQKKQADKLNQIDSKMNDINSKLDALKNSSQITQMPTVQTPSTVSKLSFSDCITKSGLDENANIATTASNKCLLGGQVTRPAVFILTDETMTYVAQYGSGGSQLQNSDNENIYFRGGSSIFGDAPKAGDKFQISGRVTNQSGTYFFDSFTKVQKLS